MHPEELFDNLRKELNQKDYTQVEDAKKHVDEYLKKNGYDPEIYQVAVKLQLSQWGNRYIVQMWGLNDKAKQLLKTAQFGWIME